MASLVNPAYRPHIRPLVIKFATDDGTFRLEFTEPSKAWARYHQLKADGRTKQAAIGYADGEFLDHFENKNGTRDLSERREWSPKREDNRAVAALGGGIRRK